MTLRQIPAWRFWVPLCLQIALIVGVPAPSIYTYFTGKSVILQTMPVDPYDLLRGYSQVLSYDISNSQVLSKVTGWQELTKNRQNYSSEQQLFYVVLEAPDQATNSGQPQPWKPVLVSRDRPANLSPNQIALKGRLQYNRALYGLEEYYFPEDQRQQLNAEINRVQRTGRNNSRRPFVVEVKIDSQGNAVLVSLWVENRKYRF